jgi:hypothetical protein
MGRYADNPAAIRALYRGNEVHRDVYIDPEVYRLEMKHLFANAWVFVGHESQTPNKGDYFSTQIGDQPVIQVRHSDGEMHVLLQPLPAQGYQDRHRPGRQHRQVLPLPLSRLVVQDRWLPAGDPVEEGLRGHRL